MISPVGKGSQRLRSAAHGNHVVPPTRTVRLDPRSFAVSGPTLLWNLLSLAQHYYGTCCLLPNIIMELAVSGPTLLWNLLSLAQHYYGTCCLLPNIIMELAVSGPTLLWNLLSLAERY